MRRGYSLVELMIVIAIIGILAAIAIPNYVNMQLKAKRSEVPTNVDGIRTAEIAYRVFYDAFAAASPKPATLAKEAQEWVVGSDGFSVIGWAPAGAVRGSYEVQANGTSDLLVIGSCDVDGNGAVAQYSATLTVNTTLRSGDENVY